MPERYGPLTQILWIAWMREQPSSREVSRIKIFRVYEKTFPGILLVATVIVEDVSPSARNFYLPFVVSRPGAFLFISFAPFFPSYFHEINISRPMYFLLLLLALDTITLRIHYVRALI